MLLFSPVLNEENMPGGFASPILDAFENDEQVCGAGIDKSLWQWGHGHDKATTRRCLLSAT